MKNNFDLGQLFNRLGTWTVPLISIGIFFPILCAYLAYSQSPSPTLQSKTSFPELSQIPTPKTSPQTSLRSPQPIQQPSSKTTTPLTQKQKPSPVQNPIRTPTKAPVKNTFAKSPLVVPPNYTPPKVEIKVAIATDVNSTVIGTSAPASILDSNGRAIKTFSPSQGVWITPNGSSLTMGDRELPQMVFIQPNQGGLVYVDDRWYRGKILIVSQGSTLLIVNYVDLEEYLYSVVGSEMHSTAPIEALKAQAIAARSYALVHMIRPASAWYNLGNTQRWQVYKGVQTEYNTTNQAVSTTSGQILSYKGGVVESLYAATDEIVSWAHSGKGMSQTGAYKLAEQGYDHQQILGYYYPGVGLARLVLQQ